jgi:hypothetical protein
MIRSIRAYIDKCVEERMSENAVSGIVNNSGEDIPPGTALWCEGIPYVRENPQDYQIIKQAGKFRIVFR